MSKKNIGNLLSFVALVILALLLTVSNILPLIGINLDGSLFGLLGLIKDLAVLIVIGLGAYYFTRGNKVLNIIFWVAIIIYVACVILGLF